MRVVIQQVDLDTCLTALLMGVTSGDEVVVVRGGASESDLLDPGTICIEAGGSGRIAEGNFDHHDAGGPVEPACRQAFTVKHPLDTRLAGLVDYVAAHDVAAGGHTGQSSGRDRESLTLPALFSGLRLTIPDAKEQLFAGLDVLRIVLAESIDPAGPMPDRAEWTTYVNAKRAAWKALKDLHNQAEIFETVSGLKAGFIESDAIGALGVLYSMDCDIAIAYSPRFKAPDGGVLPKYTIGGRSGGRVDSLLPALNALELGWGGPSHGTIIASPRNGSQLRPKQVKGIVRG